MTISWENLNIKQFTKKTRRLQYEQKRALYAPRVNVKVNCL